MTPLPDPHPPARLRWSGWTDRGRVRPHNEDAWIGLRFDAEEVHHLGKVGESPTGHHDFLFAVSDGMGGAQAGEIASRIAVEKIATLLPRAYRQAAAGLSAGFADVLEELYEQIHRALVLLGGSYEECRGMETTLTLGWFTPGWLYFGHIGDSRLYRLEAGAETVRQLSHDDTHVGWLYRQGQITEYQARTHPARNRLQKALGGGNQFVSPQVGAVGCQPGDLYLLCTDGLTEGLHDRQLAELLRETQAAGALDAAARRLVEAALAADGRDNLTALVVEAG